MNALLLGLVVTASLAQMPARPTGAGPSAPAQPPAEAAATQPVQRSGPFQKLFVPQPNEARRQEKDVRAALEQLKLAQKPAPRIVCGMVVIQTDPQVDPKMVIRSPESATVMHIKKIPPAACAE
jgi:hypothetical protein